MQFVHENNPLGFLFGNSGCKPNFAVTNIFLKFFGRRVLKRNDPEKIINYCFTKSFQPKNNKKENKEIITFTRTYSPNHNFNYNRFNNC